MIELVQTVDQSSTGAPCCDMYTCFRCRKDLPAQDFLYTKHANTADELKAMVQGGNRQNMAWACQGCFLRSHFCSVAYQPALPAYQQHEAAERQGQHEMPHDAPIRCMLCREWRDAEKFACFGGWWRKENGDSGSSYTWRALDSYIRFRGLQWGCNVCFEQSQLVVHRDVSTGGWRTRYRPGQRWGMQSEETLANGFLCFDEEEEECEALASTQGQQQQQQASGEGVGTVVLPIKKKREGRKKKGLKFTSRNELKRMKAKNQRTKALSAMR